MVEDGGRTGMPTEERKACFLHSTNSHRSKKKGEKEVEDRTQRAGGVVSGDGETGGGQGGWMKGGRGEEEEEGLTIREKFRPVKVSFLPIVLVIKTACSGADRRAISLLFPHISPFLLHPYASLAQVCEQEEEE